LRLGGRSPRAVARRPPMVRPIFERGTRAKVATAVAVLGPSARPCAGAGSCATCQAWGWACWTAAHLGHWPTPVESSQGCKRQRARFSSGRIFCARNMGGLLRVAASSNPSQAERQRQATRPGLAVRGTFSPARAWRPAVVARLARTLGAAGTTSARPRASMLASHMPSAIIRA